ncbi:hypothetical protein RDI58_022362 [Solanum bulbocastanum]|uniref:Uncharacterized protein n=1 Tax=Solanum bulbocastanum TaxID=147425 RepID=A0AAN8Y802_SOLBU
MEEPSKLELKVLPAHLRYVFLGANNNLPIIIAVDFLEWQVNSLLVVWRRYIKAIGWTITDTVGIPPGICTHKIKIDSKCIQVSEPTNARSGKKWR